MNKPKLTLSLLGGVTISDNGTAVSGFASRKVEALLIYLACHPRPHPRETLAALFWPDNDQTRALANLSVALSSLRKQLATAVLAERHTIRFNPALDVEIDTAVFQQAISQVREQQKRRGKLSRLHAAQLVTAVSLYKGDFLAGFNIRRAPEFEAWALLEQERLRQMLLTALTDLISYSQQRGQFNQAIPYAQQLLAIDPLQEAVHRQLMALYAQTDQRPAALMQYETCVHILDEELGVEPDEETTALYQRLVDGQEIGVMARRDSAPLPYASAFLPNLPAAATRFMGRENELAFIERWLTEANGRLLTIVGPGGSGKSRLALEAARAQMGQFAHGVRFVSLVAYTDMDGLVTAVAEAVGLALSGKGEPAAQLRRYLQAQEMLLVLDNLEHLLSPDLRTLISHLTAEAPDLRLIATSRERLHLQAETLLDLGGLPYPPKDSPAAALDYAAIHLFSDRARRVQSAFQLETQETAVVQLCQLVGGLPLALELAATWTRLLTVAEIVAEIQRSLDALTTPLYDVAERHRSLRAVVESSWQMLTAEEKALFRQLAVFRRGFTREAAQQVVNATLPQLLSLIDRSFLRLDADQRFRRHPLLLQFSQEQLAAQPTEQIQAETAHAHYFAHFIQVQEPGFKGATARETIATVSADWENIRAAWDWALAQRDEALLAKMVTGVGRFLGDRGRPLAGTALFEESLQVIRAQPVTDSRDQLMAKMQVELGHFWDQNGRLAEAEAILNEANALCQQQNLPQTRINCLRVLGVVTDHQGRQDVALRYLEEAQALCQTEGDVDQMLPILNALGNSYVEKAEFEKADACFSEAITLAEAMGNSLRVAILQSNMAVIANRQKNYEEAIRLWRLAQQGFIAHNYEIGLANTTFNIAMARHGLEQYDEALVQIQEAYALLEKLGQRHGMAGGLGVMGMIAHKLGKRVKARRYLHDCLLLAQDIGSDGIAISGLSEIAELEISGGNMKQAVFLFMFIARHPATGGTTRKNAQSMLAELTAEFPPEMIAEAETAVRAHTLDTLIALLVNE